MKLRNFLMLMSCIVVLTCNECFVNAHGVKPSPFPFICQTNNMIGSIGFGGIELSNATSSSIF